MNMFEEARALRGMISMCKLTQSEIAEKMGVSQSYIANKIRLLNFSEYIQMKILEAELSERHARALLKLRGEEKIKLAIDRIKTMKLNVAASEAMIDNMLIDELPKSLLEVEQQDSVRRFEVIIEESARNLESCGYKVRRSVDFYRNKRYITVCIEE